jgi:hypothetical protein
MLTTLMLSFGVPMLLGGDEMGRTQQGPPGVSPPPFPFRDGSTRAALVHPRGHRDGGRRLVR